MEHSMTIDGKSVRGKATAGVINPATGRNFTEVPECTKAELDEAMAAAAHAFPSWSKDIAARKQALLACAEALKAAIPTIAPVLTQEQGKPLAKATEELYGAMVWFQYTARLDLPVEVVQDDENRRVEIRRRPLGVVAAITPWNFPVLLAVWKLAPALLAGNTVVIKPSPYTPVATLMLVEALQKALPPGVINAVSGGNELGSMMTSHPIPRKISFTGSTATGKRIAAACAPDLKRMTLELGGNDAAILLPDIDPKKVSAGVFWGAFSNSGQICSAIKRVYVHESQYQAVLDELAQHANGVKVGNGMDEGTELGPINNKMQFDRVTELVEDAKKQGATVAAGGERLGNEGYFFKPTILGNVTDGVRIVDEEQFGPALPVIPYKNVADAIASANSSNYGLSGSVWGTSTEAATDVAGQLECGSAWVNQHLAIAPNLPFGGAKWSGVGVENGPWGLLGFTEIQCVNIAKK